MAAENPLYSEPVVQHLGPCATCGNPAQKVSSGTPECWRCWDYRKLHGPAVDYWTKRIPQLFEYGPDGIDWELWEAWGMREAMNKALHTLLAVNQAFEEMKANPRPWKKAE